jgi:hypothetical protein
MEATDGSIEKATAQKSLIDLMPESVAKYGVALDQVAEKGDFKE